ncbi:MAG: prolyl oligopeptidase family serine peptidase [Bacteroidia bacterium]|nr:prolyl oligopeptidase family serine peptidase [Bacteroidia bacterium]
MNPLYRYLLLLLWFTPSWIQAQELPKKALSPGDFASWKVLQAQQLSHNGAYATWEENAQQYGDGALLLAALPDGTPTRFERGGSASFAGDLSYLAFLISPQFDSTRKAKLDEVAKDKRPKDSLAIWMLDAKELVKIPRVKSFAVPKYQGSWMAYHEEKALPTPKDSTKQDSAKTDSAKKEKAPKDKETPLVLFHPPSGEKISVREVQSYAVSDSGRLMALITVSGDSIDSVQVHVFTPLRKQLRLIYEGPGYAESLTFDRSGKRLAFVATRDTGDVKVYSLFGYQMEEAQARKLVDTATSTMPKGWCVSPNGDLYFSQSGNRLFFGTAVIPQPEPEDTLLDEEKASLDVWTWQDAAVQPEQLLDADSERKRSYLAVWLWQDARMVQLGHETLPEVSPIADRDGPFALGRQDTAYAISRSWAYPWQEDIYLVDIATGKSSPLLAGAGYGLTLAPKGTFAVYWDEKALAWQSIETSTGKVTNLTGDLKVNFFDEDHDSPHDPYAYGFEGFYEGESEGLFYDRYDLWKISLDGSAKPVNLSKGWGRKNLTRLRAVTLDYEELYFSPELLLSSMNETTKAEGYYAISSINKQEPTALMLSDHRFGSLMKAKNADRILWRKESYREYPDLWTSTLDFTQPKRLSDANPQTADYAWGNVRLVSWKAYDGTQLSGLLYSPENLDPSNKYPLLVYFYELVSDRLNSYAMPSPSRSIISPSYYASNGYAIFMPDIVYSTGQPGPDAYNCIVSGTEAMVKQFPWIDSTKMALQGQSWGGYQTAYLVTRTNLYACAMAGAPVSNMTSAYGGIRWGSGLSRMFQYERTQSRLGTTLWEDRERYIANSPIFFADQVTTPLLMMHNDADGAVPWYQGIEYFMALRRLSKPVWLLVYNGEEHNLTRWPNRMDLTIRMHQFFDHYLMDQPAPVWMTEGVPAVKKGLETGYQLSEE